MNIIYKIAETSIRENTDATNDDEPLRILQEAVVDEDEYLRFRITERFSALMKTLFEAHKKDALPVEQAGILGEMKDGFQTYFANKEKEGSERAKLVLLAKQIGLNIAKLTDEEIAVLVKALMNSDLYKKDKTTEMKLTGISCKRQHFSIDSHVLTRVGTMTSNELHECFVAVRAKVVGKQAVEKGANEFVDEKIYAMNAYNSL